MNINELILKRRTIRKFTEQCLSMEQLLKYIDAARVAPSAANLQPLKYVAVVNRETRDLVFETLKWAGYLNGEYTPKVNERPTGYIAVCVDSEISKANYDMDVGAAAQSIILSALEDGIGCCWLMSVERAKLKKILSLPNNLEISCVLALGYPAEQPREVEMEEDNVKYYLENGILNVPKRKLEDIIIKLF